MMVDEKESIEAYEKMYDFADNVMKNKNVTIMTVYFSEQADSQQEKLMTLELYQNRVLAINTFDEAEKIDELKQHVDTTRTKTIATYGNNTLVEVSIDVNNRLYIGGVSSPWQGDFRESIRFELNYDRTRVYKFLLNDKSNNQIVYEFQIEGMPSNPLKNFVLDYYGFEYDDECFVIRYFDGQMTLLAKVRSGEKDIYLSMNVTIENGNNTPKIIDSIIDYLNSKQQMVFDDEWPQYYKDYFALWLGTSDIPMPNGLSLYNDLVMCYKDVCAVMDYQIPDDFLSNYKLKLQEEGYEVHPTLDYIFYKIFDDEKKNYLLVGLVDEGDGNIFIFITTDMNKWNEFVAG